MASTGTDADTDVVVVGCGPTGLVLAILLAQQGRRVVVWEQRAEPYPLPRAVHFDHEVGRILQSCGIGAELRAISEPADVYEWRNAAGTTLLRFGLVGAAASGWPISSMFCQPELESALDRRARDLPSIDVRRGVELAEIQAQPDHVVVTDTAGSRVTARYVVGCDGAHSTVRRLLGVEMVDLGYFFDWFVVDVLLGRPRVFDPVNLQVCDPYRPTTAVSGGPGRRRWEFMLLPGERSDDFGAEDHVWDLLAPWGIERGVDRIERRADYTFQARYAASWRQGRVFLAGDAAHQTPPFAGQGLCAGVRDAANLAWKLDLALAGVSAERLLDSYELERLPHARRTIEFAMELGRVICVSDPAEAAARDDAMAAAVTDELIAVPGLPPLGTGWFDEASRYGGDLFVQGTDAGRPFDDVHGAGWRMISTCDAVGRLAHPDRVWFESIGGRVVSLHDPDPVYARWFAEHDADVALQRPDFHLYGTARDRDGATALLARLRAHLAPLGER